MNTTQNIMLNKEKHKFIMVQMLKDVYSDVEISSLLGFKGGTAASLFYDLPRFSVDLDFDLLDASGKNTDLIYEKMEKIIQKYGEIKDSQNKFMTIFFSLSYESGEHQIKVEINTRKTGAQYVTSSYLGIPMLVAEKESMLAGKLMALVGRKKVTARDVFDLYYFFKQGWEIENDVLVAYGVRSLKSHLEKCIDAIENIPESKILYGLGELIDEKQKTWVRAKLKSETVFLLRLLMENEKSYKL